MHRPNDSYDIIISLERPRNCGRIRISSSVFNISRVLAKATHTRGERTPKGIHAYARVSLKLNWY